MLTPDDRALSDEFLNQPINFGFRYTSAADRHLREILFRSLARNRNDYLCLFFPHGTPDDRSRPWSLKEAQGAEEGAEYTAAAKGTACGHIFKTGESTYHCKTCAADDTP
ncbi:E3 ubiquitin-protein ligase ubr1 [Friedmanniomyces endolithicus]|nr:E3 ubiquitin-protein ligase ubr1 [Friedmanniomyces endolithicus]